MYSGDEERLGRHGADARDHRRSRAKSSGSICFGRGTGILGVDLPTSDLLSRRGKYTRVYTRVYPRVYYSVHACTQLRSKYVRCRAPVVVSIGGLMSWRCGGYGWVSLGIGGWELRESKDGAYYLMQAYVAPHGEGHALQVTEIIPSFVGWLG